MKVRIFWKCIQYTIRWDKTQILKKFSSGTKNALFFLSRAPNHHSFIFNLRFFYYLKVRLKVRLSKTVCGNFHFQFRFVFIKVYVFAQHNVIICLKIKIIEKCGFFAVTVLLPDPWFLSWSKKIQNSMISAWGGAPQKLT